MHQNAPFSNGPSWQNSHPFGMVPSARAFTYPLGNGKPIFSVNRFSSSCRADVRGAVSLKNRGMWGYHGDITVIKWVTRLIMVNHG